MGKASRKRKHKLVMEAKARRKEAKRALYKSYAEHGQANKTKRHKAKPTEASGKKGQHVMADCDNVGCIRCYPNLNNYQLNNGKYRLPNHPVKLIAGRKTA